MEFENLKRINNQFNYSYSNLPIKAYEFSHKEDFVCVTPKYYYGISYLTYKR